MRLDRGPVDDGATGGQGHGAPHDRCEQRVQVVVRDLAEVLFFVGVLLLRLFDAFHEVCERVDIGRALEHVPLRNARGLGEDLSSVAAAVACDRDDKLAVRRQVQEHGEDLTQQTLRVEPDLFGVLDLELLAPGAYEHVQVVVEHSREALDNLWHHKLRARLPREQDQQTQKLVAQCEIAADLPLQTALEALRFVALLHTPLGPARLEPLGLRRVQLRELVERVLEQERDVIHQSVNEDDKAALVLARLGVQLALVLGRVPDRLEHLR